MNTIANESYEVERWVDSMDRVVGYSLHIGRQQLVPPFTIEPYGCKQGYVFFVTLQDNIDDISHIIFQAVSTRKIFRKVAPISNVKIPHLANIRQNRFILQKQNKEQ